MINIKNPQISIIVPIYNAEKYLDQCLKSIVTQTYRNLEIILVDDGSTDNSGTICDQYASNDARVIVIHKPNEGVSCARNKGIEMAQGEYIMFVDSDDWVDENICKILFEAVVTYNVQAAMCAYMREYPNKSLPKILHESDTVFNGKAMQRMLCGPIANELKNPENMDSYGTLWGHIYPARVLKQYEIVDLQKIGTAEDVLFNFTVFSNIEDIVYINKPLYHYRKGMNTSITSAFKADLDQKWGCLYAEFEKHIRGNGLDLTYYQALSNRIAVNTLGLGLNCIAGGVKFGEKHRRIRRVLSNPERKNALKQLSIKNMPIKWKIFFVCAKYRLSFTFTVLLILISNLKGKM